MFKYLFFFTIVCTSSVAIAQLRAGFESNTQYYIDDDKIQLDPLEAKNRFRSNSYIKASYQRNQFGLEVQGEAYLPKALLQYNPQLQKYHIGTIAARYNNNLKGIDITAGHLYEQFGSGLALRFWEDRALGINNALLGGRLKWNIDNTFQIKILAGKQRIGMGFDLSKGIIGGADATLDISQLLKKEDYVLKLGTSLVAKQENIPNTQKNTAVIGFRADYNTTNFNIDGEYLYKTKEIHYEQKEFYPNIHRAGSALLLNMGYNVDNWAFNFNFRRLENFSFFSQKNLSENIYNYGMINYIPALTKQYDHSLQHIYTYQAQPNMSYYTHFKKQGEIGGQFDLYYEAPASSILGGKTGASFSINGSYWAGLKNHIKTTTVKDKYGTETELIELNTSPFIALGDTYYHDIGVEYKKPFSERFSSIISYLHQYFNSAQITLKPHQVQAHTIATEGTYFLSNTQSIRLELQHQWANADLKNWAGATLEYVPNTYWSFFINDMYNYGNDDSDKKLHYYNIGTAFTHKTTRVTMSYGRQRGGVLCVGGICRTVAASAGLTLNLTTQL